MDNLKFIRGAVEKKLLVIHNVCMKVFIDVIFGISGTITGKIVG